MENNKAVFSINTTEFNLKGKHLSFALKPKIIYNDILSFYYFRVLYFKKNETKYYPIDSYLGNLCKPEFNNDTNYYYCNFILRNDYNESNIIMNQILNLQYLQQINMSILKYIYQKYIQMKLY